MQEIMLRLMSISPGQIFMIFIGIILLYLAIYKKYEPTLLLPMGFGVIMVNIPFSGASGGEGIIDLLFKLGITTELFPLLIFIGIGAMIDFGALLERPSMIFFGAAAQIGIFITILLALALGFDIKEAASIGIIGAADGPTSIYVANKLAPDLLGPISVAAYSYMALVPIIQPLALKLVTTKKDRQIKMSYTAKNVSKKAKIMFPIIVTISAGIIAPASVPLIGFLMLGNLMRESGVVDRLSETAQKELVNITTILLGVSISATMTADKFLAPATLMILAMGLFAFVFDTMGGALFVKFLNLFIKNKINPLVGAAGISAFPMSARTMQIMAKKEDPHNFILMHSISANVAGQIASVIVGGLILSMML